jgi:hypothetical protein
MTAHKRIQKRDKASKVLNVCLEAVDTEAERLKAAYSSGEINDFLISRWRVSAPLLFTRQEVCLTLAPL